MESSLGLYAGSLSLLTDLYQLTMAYASWRNGLRDREAVFHLHFRKNPFGGGYTLAAGLASVVDYLRAFRFSPDDVAFLRTLTGNDGAALFDEGFLEMLSTLKLECDIDAIPEGTVVFPHEPLVRVRGPLMQCQLLETPLLNLVNFQTLIATKASRVRAAAKGDSVLEFGLRRAQNIDGAVSASRAAYVGGCDATSNVLAGKLFGIPVRGTHAHSWVMSFDTEMESFEAYAAAMPNNCVFLVDTFDTVQGVRHAVEVGKQLRARGHELAGVRLDSGDLAYLSIEARRILDEGGFPNAAIVASNDLDEGIITSLKEQGAAINVWGVGTKLITAYDQPALGGVYKLGAIRSPGSPWKYRIKLSEQAIKISTPGIQNVRRFRNAEGFIADMIFDTENTSVSRTIVDPLDPTRERTLSEECMSEDLLQPVMRSGKIVYDVPAASVSRARGIEQLAQIHPGIRRFVNPHGYPVGLEKALHERKTVLIRQARGLDTPPGA